MNKLSERLNELAIRVEDLEQQYEAAKTEASEALEERITEAKAAAEVRREEIADAMGLAEARIDSFMKELQKNYNDGLAQLKSALTAGAGEFEHSSAVLRADDAESYALFALDFALLALADAEVAVMEAVDARAYAESLA
jgi:hypothetical protein